MNIMVFCGMSSFQKKEGRIFQPTNNDHGASSSTQDTTASSSFESYKAMIKAMSNEVDLERESERSEDNNSNGKKNQLNWPQIEVFNPEGESVQKEGTPQLRGKPTQAFDLKKK